MHVYLYTLYLSTSNGEVEENVGQRMKRPNSNTHKKFEVIGIHPISLTNNLKVCFCLSPPVQWRLGRQVRCHRWLREGGSWWNHYKIEIGLRDLVWWLLPEAEAWFQPEEPLVSRVLAASLPVQTEGASAGEHLVQSHMHLLVAHRHALLTSSPTQSYSSLSKVIKLYILYIQYISHVHTFFWQSASDSNGKFLPMNPKD